MKKYTYTIIVTMFFTLTSALSFAQEETVKKVEKPVREPWQATTLIESQTVIGVEKNQLELIIHHRFGAISNGFTDIFGIYAASNIRMGLQYGITDKLTIGIGTEKTNKLTDLSAKYVIFQQTRSGSMPLSLSVHANVALDSRDEQFFGANYEYTDRFSYFSQIIASRKFTDALSIQIAPAYAHFNSVDSVYQNDKAAVMIGGRYKFTGSMSAIVEYHQPISINPPRDYHNDIEPGLAFGLEIATSTHAFQVFATNYQGIMAQKNYVMNTNKFNSEGILVGFNITVRF